MKDEYLPGFLNVDTDTVNNTQYSEKVPTSSRLM